MRDAKTLAGSVGKIPLTKKQLTDLVRLEANTKIGPWPRNMQVIVYPLEGCWRILIGYSDLAETKYRDRVIALSAELRDQFSLLDDSS
jgi:hypothetical protein